MSLTIFPVDHVFLPWMVGGHLIYWLFFTATNPILGNTIEVGNERTSNNKKNNEKKNSFPMIKKSYGIFRFNKTHRPRLNATSDYSN